MITFKTLRRFALALLAPAALLFSAAGPPAPAQAAEIPKPGWQATSFALPTDLVPGAAAVVGIRPLNVGAADSSGEITVTDTLPAGVTATDAGALTSASFSTNGPALITHEFWQCTIAAGSATPPNSVVTCHNDPSTLPTMIGGAGAESATISPAEEAAGVPLEGRTSYGYETSIGIAVEVAAAPQGAQPNQVVISGGGAKESITTAQPLTVGSGPPSFGFAGWDVWFSNADGTLDARAGSVPYSATFSLDLNRIFEEERGEGGEFAPAPGNRFGEPRNFFVDLPPGFIGYPNAVPKCPRQRLSSEDNGCPTGTVVGYVKPYTGIHASFPVFNMVPPPGVAAEFAFTYESIQALLDSGVRTGAGYGIHTRVANLPQRNVVASTLTLWGVPHDPSHDRWRLPGLAGPFCSPTSLEPGGACYLPPDPDPKPLLRLPTSCAGPQPFAIAGVSWLDPTLTGAATALPRDGSGAASGFTGCNQLAFAPTITAKPTTDVADAPSGLEFDLHIPQPEVVNPIEEGGETVAEDPAPHEADLKDAVVTLPKGIAVNPSGANGLAACSSAQFGLTSAIGATPITTIPDPATCPDAAKIGSVEVISPLVDHPVKGGVYVATPKDNPFGSLLAIYIAVNDVETGTVLKFAGQVEADPVTGQLKASFDNNPQLPFNDFHLNFFGGAHGALRTPTICGTYQTTSQMTPWSTPEGADATPADSFETTTAPGGGACATTEAALPNKPTFTAGTITPRAGAYSPFVLHLARQDGSQELKAIDTTLPEGLLGKLAGISECSDAQIALAASRNKLGQGKEEIASPSCPLNSEVGTVNVGAGAGPDPYYVQGHAYLAGPYKGAPLSLEIITPAVAGPYDLGAVAVRTALYLNPETAQIHAVSDPIPTILQGIPLDVRSINLEMNRNQFTLNPTSCAKKTILGTSISVLNQPAALSSPFQVGECSKLGFAPKLKLSLKGATKRNRFPSLKAVLTYPKGSYANIARASVALPHSEFLEQAHIGTICTRVQFAEGNTPGEKCPPASVYGFARAITPLLDKPVEGPVYLRSSSHNLPDLVAALDGQIHVDLVGRIDTDKQAGIRNTFDLVPDAPVSRFVLEMKGGKKGLLVNSENICRKAQRATARFTAQNGKVSDYRPLIGNSCAKKSKKHKGHHAR